MAHCQDFALEETKGPETRLKRGEERGVERTVKAKKMRGLGDMFMAGVQTQEYLHTTGLGHTWGVWLEGCPSIC